MTSPILETIAQSMNYGDLPETWRVPEIEQFSDQKTLYDYQTNALENAARALFLYYEKEHDWRSDESSDVNSKRKQKFENLYRDFRIPALKKYETPTGQKNQTESPIFRILSDFMEPRGDLIPYHNLINRMCFWMATGSGKTLVMVKLIEYLHSLQRHGEIPPHNILILAPSEHLIRQIQKTVDEFNANGLYIDLVPLRHIHRSHQARLGGVITVYYHRSDNISDVQKDALTDYRIYENGGKWFILLDEAHKGGKENSKRQAYYAIMAREGFLFNFSATFTDTEDIVTTVKKYNLEEFIKNGHGKNIYLNKEEYDVFRNRGEEISHEERRKIVLKSLITLAYVSMRVGELRKNSGLRNLYHLPLMLTLVNSVNTDIENERNDLWAFFQTLREIAMGKIEELFFRDSKAELIRDWTNAKLLFGEDGGGIIGADDTSIQAMKITDLREAVFLSRKQGALQFIRSGDHKELAFQMRNADAPFALIRIGDTSKWRNDLLAGYEETTTLQEKSFFDGLEHSPITILMGSRSFFESWDSNRPNVINFINIGGTDARKFVVQSVGRGVRIEPLPGKRKRLARLLPALQGDERSNLERCHDQVQPPETLFLFATNRAAVEAVLSGLGPETRDTFEELEGFETVPVPKVGNMEMPLLVPEYKESQKGVTVWAKFAMSDETLDRLKSWLEKTTDSVFVVRDGLEANKISELRGMVEQSSGILISPEKKYEKIPFLQNRLVSHLSQNAKISDGVRELGDKDIVHFRQIRVHHEYARELQEKISRVVQGETPDKRMLAKQFADGAITQEEYEKHYAGKDEESFKNLKIKKLLGHYYMPVVLGDEKSDYIKHIIKIESEVEFLNALEKWMDANQVPWDAWMFSKIDESLDEIYIPYYDLSKNEYRRFFPDFVFWMCRGNEYRIVFVDPKGEANTSAYHKIDDYQKLFESPVGNVVGRQFRYAKKWKVSVALLMFNLKSPPLQNYQRYWTNQPEDIFRFNMSQHSDP